MWENNHENNNNYIELFYVATYVEKWKDYLKKNIGTYVSSYKLVWCPASTSKHIRFASTEAWPTLCANVVAQFSCSPRSGQFPPFMNKVYLNLPLLCWTLWLIWRGNCAKQEMVLHGKVCYTERTYIENVFLKKRLHTHGF